MRRPVPAYAAANESRVIADLNMTPLIDVLLVLIVMFILLVPAMTHEVSIDLPSGPAAVGAVTPHRLVMTRDGAVTLDGVGVSGTGLGERLAELVRADGRTTVVLASDPLARYERVDQVLAVVKRAKVTRLGFEGLREMDRVG